MFYLCVERLLPHRTHPKDRWYAVENRAEALAVLEAEFKPLAAFEPVRATYTVSSAETGSRTERLWTSHPEAWAAFDERGDLEPLRRVLRDGQARRQAGAA